MSEVIFPDQLVAQLEPIAEYENRSPVDVVKTLLDNYTSSNSLRQACQYRAQVGVSD